MQENSVLPDPAVGAVPVLDTLPNRLRAARLRTGKTQQEFADTIGLSRTTISAAEAGSKSPSRTTLTMWAMASGVMLDWIREGGEPV